MSVDYVSLHKTMSGCEPIFHSTSVSVMCPLTGCRWQGLDSCFTSLYPSRVVLCFGVFSSSLVTVCWYFLRTGSKDELITFYNTPSSLRGAKSFQHFQSCELIWQLMGWCGFHFRGTGTLGLASWIVDAYRFGSRFLLGVICLLGLAVDNFFCPPLTSCAWAVRACQALSVQVGHQTQPACA